MTEIQKPEIIVFDLGNVLIPFHYDLIINRLNEKDAGLGERFVKKYMENYEVHRNFEKGKMSEEEFLSVMREWTENKVSDEEFKKIYSEIFTVNDEMISLLPELKNKYRLMLLSNTNSIHKKYGWEKFPFLSNFEKLFLSHEVGAVKPEEEIYRTVENYTKAKPDAHLFIDDVEEYALTAQKLGWQAIHFISEKQAVAELKKFL